ncbi:MAG: Nramp family divalent metal transporter [Coriobacteriia bacterium]|nr:Nramp family divalent metal transporter [Coriobacteriia bacterium]
MSNKETEQQTPKVNQKQRWMLVLGAMGPGILTAMAGNDAGGISTYSSAGALFGYKTLWMILIMTFLLVVVQESAARMGVVTGKGFASLIREKFGIRLSTLAMLALVVSNIAITFSEFAGIASGMELFGIPKYVSVPLAGLAVWLLVMSGSYQRVEKILLAVSSVFITYVIAAFLAGPNWGEVARATFIPEIVPQTSFVSLTIAAVGATIAPWMIFLAQNNVVDKGADIDTLPYQRIDAITGAVLGCLVAWFIIISTGAVLYPEGIVVEEAADAARALAPVVGPYAEKLFAAGLVAASFLAACVLPGVTSSAVCEAFGWERGENRSWEEAPTYKSILTAIIILAVLIVLIPGINLFQVMIVAQIIAGILLPILLFFLVFIINDKRIMGKYKNGKVSNILTWFTIITVTILTIILFVMSALGFA